jgi:hypothetical protein
MTLAFEKIVAPEGIKAGMAAADSDHYFDIERSSALAAHALKKLGIPLKQAESHWEVDSDNSSLLLCLANSNQTQMVTISIQAFPHTETPDEVTIQMVNAKEHLDETNTLGVEFRVAIERDTNKVTSESVKIVSVYNKVPTGSVQRCIHRTDVMRSARWGISEFNSKYRESRGLRITMSEVRHSPSIMDANNKLTDELFKQLTHEEFAFVAASDSFDALTTIAGDVSSFRSIPVEQLN